MKTNIEFASPDTANNETTPWVTPKKSTYLDMVLKPEYEARRLRFPVGTTWLRIVRLFNRACTHGCFRSTPSTSEGGRFAHHKHSAKTPRRVITYTWTKEHHPESLFSKENKTGARFLTDPMCVFWAIVDEGGKHLVRLLLASGYDGSRGRGARFSGTGSGA